MLKPNQYYSIFLRQCSFCWLGPGVCFPDFFFILFACRPVFSLCTAVICSNACGSHTICISFTPQPNHINSSQHTNSLSFLWNFNRFACQKMGNLIIIPTFNSHQIAESAYDTLQQHKQPSTIQRRQTPPREGEKLFRTSWNPNAFHTFWVMLVRFCVYSLVSGENRRRQRRQQQRRRRRRQ